MRRSQNTTLSQPHFLTCRSFDSIALPFTNEHSRPKIRQYSKAEWQSKRPIIKQLLLDEYAAIFTPSASGAAPYVTSINACSAQYIATTTCTSFYFNVGVNCNLHYRLVSYILNTNKANSYSLYKISCFDYYNLALTTTFTPPPAAAFTEIVLSSTDLWQNTINLVLSSTITSYYLSQFYSSALATASSISLPPFCAIVCPYS